VTVRTFALASFLVAGLPVCAFAGEASYTTDDLVNYYLSMAQGPARGICVGTAEECGTMEVKKQRPFDLRINFEKDSATLTETAKDNLLTASKAMMDPRLKSAKITIDGYTDASGTEEYNFGLSERRAEAVVTYLGELGVDTSRLVAKGYGETNLLSQDPMDPSNRRVETRLIIE
jgi:outer membrane protein OmpA-like peptidoglycan-associated protein